MHGRFLLPLATAVALVLAGTHAVAQTASDKALAEALYDEGKRLLESGEFGPACEKLATSSALDAGVGSLLSLGFCYERLGRSASAWATYREAAAMATKQGDRRESLARARVSALEPGLARLLVVTAAPVPTMTIVLDGKPLPSAALDIAMPIDPGSHVLHVSAPGREPWRYTFTAVAEQPPLRVEVPALPRTAPPSSGEPGGWPWNRYAAVVGFGAAAVLGAGAIGLAVDSKNRFDDTIESGDCTPTNVCNTRGLAAYDAARAEQAWAIGLGVAAGGMLVAGTVLVALPSLRTSSSTPRVRAAWAGTGFELVGSF